ncbi:helix-turn-helix transcriptional regulator [Arthrobacter sp. LAPM80]|uniref:helix-turn-helix domain-containing protein n=1 Tax=Arthrobacter sp. LAPM80 TaxID=3141788 RepID=UPI00398AF07B
MGEPNNDEAVGKRIQELRERKGLFQSDLASLMRTAGVNWSQGTLSRVELGARAVRLTEAPALAGALGVDVSALFPQTSPIAAELTTARWNERTVAGDVKDLKRKLESATRKYVRANRYRQAIQLINELSEGSARHYVAHCPPPALWDVLLDRHIGEPDRITAAELCHALGLDVVLVEDSWAQFSNTASQWKESGQTIRDLGEMLADDVRFPFDDDAVSRMGRSNTAKHIAKMLRSNQLGKLMGDAFPNISWINDADSRPITSRREEVDLDWPLIEGLRELPENAELS